MARGLLGPGSPASPGASGKTGLPAPLSRGRRFLRHARLSQPRQCGGTVGQETVAHAAA